MLYLRIKLWSLWRFPTVNASPSVPDAEMTAPTCNGWGGFVLSAHHDVLTFVQCWAILTQTRRRLAACCGA